MYVCHTNSWDLKAYKQKTRKTLHEYIHCFSKQHSELIDIVNVNVIGAFISLMTNEALVHKLRRNKPWTIQGLLNLTTSHGFGEEAVQANFCKDKGKVQAETIDEVKDCAQWERSRRTVGGVVTVSLSP